ncbi:hypothetical protein [Arenimonas oryziterrae]|uniref:Uncharacterized protein n=1 Tax=Arenimonas oryziterrae DSM 21050 = YC6267 TaxID=1121015 RepID=A0A091APN4_9GAMM|nr:hypothetical protein [Arenimonas oryziterrae]KFN41341.1 hypothetical protein N789_05560 [Arenimonas oryziterrae DSM 21050 = YC6267]
MKVLCSLVFLSVLGLMQPAVARAPAVEDPINVSIIQLLATPEKFEGKLILVRGYVHFEFEGNGIYLHREDYEHGLTSNGLWVDARECSQFNGKSFKSGYAYVAGRFTARERGHMGMWSGEIQQVQRCLGAPD